MEVPYPPESDPEAIAEVAVAHPRSRRFLRLLPILVVAAALALVFGTGLNHYVSLDFLQVKRQMLVAYVGEHPILGISVYVVGYSLMVALSVPGAMIMSMSGGFLFGAWVGSAAAVTGMTVGATAMFLVARSAIGDFLKRHTPAGGIVQRVEAGVRANAFSYLLILRLLPAVPFWLCNIASGFVSIPLKTYVAATILGVIPSTFIYCSIGSGLGHVFDRGEKPNLGLILDPAVMLPLLGLAALSILPLIYHGWRMRRERPIRPQIAE